MACVFVLRLPSALVPHELSVDEGQILSEAMKFQVDPRPWIAIDGTTSGPLNSYLVLAFLLTGFKPTFVLVHMLGNVLVCLQVLIAYLTLRRLGSEKTAALGGLLMVLFYGLTTHTDYLHYSSELLPTLLLMVGFYTFLAWLDGPAERSTGIQLCLLFLSGLSLGTAPWCKVQAVPMTGALGLVVLAAIIFHGKGFAAGPSRRLKETVAFCSGALLTTCLMLAILAECGAITDFWYSYILGTFAYAGRFSLTRTILNLALAFLISPLHQLAFVAAIGVAMLIYSSRRSQLLLAFKTQAWAYSSLLVYAGAAFFSVCRSTHFSPHYAIFLAPPLTYIAAVLATHDVTEVTQSRRRPRTALLVALLCFTVALYAAYVVRYGYMLKAIRELAQSPSANVRTAKKVSDTPGADTNDTRSRLKDVLARSIGPPRWRLLDSNERIAAVVGEIQHTRPVRSLAIWGWAPGVYVLTGMPPATRDSVGHFVITKGPLQPYYLKRFVADLRKQPPDLFIDAVAEDAFMWQWTENDGYESDPELKNFIDSNYVLVDELMLVQGAKPVRFFARRETR